MVDGRFFGHFSWKVEGSSAHTRESRAAHVCHVQLICGKLLYGGGEPSCMAHVCHVWQLTCTLLLYGGGEPSRVAHMCHVWQLTCTLLLYGGGEPSCVACVAINVHVTTIWWRGALTCGSHLSRVAINVHVTTIWCRGPSRVAHMCHMWQLTCMLLLYGGGEPSCVAHVHSN